MRDNIRCMGFAKERPEEVAIVFSVVNCRNTGEGS